MKDRLEKFVEDNRTAFDLHEPTPAVWKNIEANVLSKKKRTFGYMKYAAAAAIFIIGFTVGTVKQNFTAKPNKKELLNQSQIIESEYYYMSQINQRMGQLEPYFASDPKLKQDIQIDFEELDEFYKQLKTDLDDNINNQHVIEAMIQSYEMKLSILETLLLQLKQDKTSLEGDGVSM